MESGPLEMVERLHRREVSLLEPQGRGVLVPHVQFALEQLLQIVFVCPTAIARLPGEGRLLASDGGHLEDLHILVHDGVSWGLTHRSPPASKKS